MTTQLHPLWLLGASVAVALLPTVIALTTSYLKVNVVVGMMKSALGVQHAPGVMGEMALTLAVTIYVMTPVVEDTSRILSSLPVSTFLNSPSADAASALLPALVPMKTFLANQAGDREVYELLDAQEATVPDDLKKEEVPLKVLLPAFILSELKEGFSMGFRLLLPFLAVDLIVANILAGMGMMMVSPTLITLPLKLLLFVAADGWLLLTRALIASYQVGG